MAGSDRASNPERARSEAADWFARMRAPDAEASRLAFERWRAKDPANRVAYARLDTLWEAAAGLSDTDLARAPVFARRGHFLAAPASRLALTIVLLALVGAGASMLLPRAGSRAPATAQAAPIATAVGEIRPVRLADGSTVTLDADSAIQVLVSRTARTVRLIRGRARFEVAVDPARPFTVEAGSQIVTARGTLFDVGLCQQGVQVALLRGSVEVRSMPAGPVARLRPGQSLVAQPGSAARVAAAPAGADQWVAGTLSYDRAPLETVLEEANRYSANKIRLGSASLVRLRVTGVFRARPTAELAVALAAAFSLRVERAANGDFILHER